jgi:putative transcriptional regulator
MKKNYKNLSVAESLIHSLEEAVKYEKGKKVNGVKTNSITIAPLPDYKANKIKEIRNKLGLTQSIFAYAIGVSIKTVEAWESGRNHPNGPAQRILFLLENDKSFLRKYKIIGKN